jgi:hypothetical protein
MVPIKLSQIEEKLLSKTDIMCFDVSPIVSDNSLGEL